MQIGRDPHAAEVMQSHKSHCYIMWLHKKKKKKTTKGPTHIHGGRNHICRLRWSCRSSSTTGSRRRGPEVCSCCTQCPRTGRGIYRTPHQRCRTSPSPLLRGLNIKTLAFTLIYRPSIFPNQAKGDMMFDTIGCVSQARKLQRCRGYLNYGTSFKSRHSKRIHMMINYKFIVVNGIQLWEAVI